ncbi:MAG: ATP-binding protein [Candidatus Sumerlaeia bacterium]|nr:ATP-binding protein [Candidatus Sumerlaeia bacterium]
MLRNLWSSFLAKLRQIAFATRLAVTLLTLLLLVFNLALWVLAVRLFQIQETASRQTIRASGELISKAISPSDLFFLQIAYDPVLEATDFERLAIYQDSTSVANLQNSFAKSASNDPGNEESGAFELALITPDGWLALDAEGLKLEPVLPTYFDAGETLDRAKDGLVALSPWTNLSPTEENNQEGIQRIRHAYFPIFASESSILTNSSAPRTPIAILQLSYHEPVSRLMLVLPRRLSLIALISFVLVVSLWIAFNRIISRSLKIQQAAEQGDRLRALGNLTAGVAHEIRNPLGILLLTLEEQRAIVRKMEDSPLKQDLQKLEGELHSEIKRLEDLSEQFLAFTRGHVSKKRLPLDPPKPFRELTEQTVKLFSKSLASDIRMDFQSTLQPEDKAAVNPQEWRQILLNILQNSAQAMEQKKGVIKVEQFRQNHLLVTIVKDTGLGMDKQTIARVFDPFFTTRAEGTGLGLSLCKKLVEDARGSLELESEPGKGCTVTIRIPVLNTETLNEPSLSGIKSY